MAQELVGKDGKVKEATLDTVIVGDGIAVLDAGFYIVKSVASPTGIPPSTAEGDDIGVGDIFQSLGNIILETDDEVYPLILEDLCSISSFSLAGTADEFDVTTFCNNGVKVYTKGLLDISGTIEGIVNASDVSKVGGFNNSFYDVINQVGETTVTKNTALEKTYLLQLYLNEIGEEQSFVLLPAQLTTVELGANISENQTFSSTIRPSVLTTEDDVKINLAVYGFKAS